MKAVHLRTFVILDQTARGCLSSREPLYLVFRERCLAKIDYPEFRMSRTLNRVLRARFCAAKAGRTVDQFAFFQVFGPYWFSAESFDKLSCPTDGLLIGRKDRGFVQNVL